MNLCEIIKNSAEKYGDRTAIVFYDRRISYADLYADIRKFSAVVAGLEIEQGKRVALALPNVPEYAIALFGALGAGAEIVSINPLYTPREIEHILRDANVGLVITHPMFEQSVRDASRGAPVSLLYSDSLGDPAKTDIRKLISSVSSGIDPVDKAPDDTALIVYTNAYRGNSLGACLTHEGLAFDAESCRQVASVNENDSFIATIPLFHAFALTVCMNLPLLTGAKTVFHEMFNEDRVVADIQKERTTIFAAVPTVFKRIYDKYGKAGLDFSFVKAFISGGAPLSLNLWMDFCTAFNAKLYEGYGITECGPVTSVNPINIVTCKPGSIGPPLNGISVRIEDEEGNVLPPRTTGELVIRGKNVMREYLNQPEETAKFLRDGWLHTGDLAWMDEDGYIYITGHIKRLILVGGFNVYPPEVEQVLSSYPGVRSCRVFGTSDESLGERVMAEVTAAPGAVLELPELRKFLKSKLAPYKAPRRIEIMESSPSR
ncbi:MAG TPA: AMP-binding protein [bacterium]|nr:AMP-binding protein [bacterium]